MKQKLYSCKAVENLIAEYQERGGDCIQTAEGCCGCGDWICILEGYKTAIIKEIALNCWSSAHKVRFYNEIPKKYAALIEAAQT